MSWLFATIGALIGAIIGALFGEKGLIPGALLGFLLGDRIQLRKRLRALEDETVDLRRAGSELADMVIRRGQDASKPQTPRAAAHDPAPDVATTISPSSQTGLGPQAYTAARAESAAPSSASLNLDEVLAALNNVPTPNSAQVAPGATAQPSSTAQPSLTAQPSVTAPPSSAAPPNIELQPQDWTLPDLAPHPNTGDDAETAMPQTPPDVEHRPKDDVAQRERAHSGGGRKGTAGFDPVAWVIGYFTGGNIVVRIGVIVLFFGVAFLLKYASEFIHVSIEQRLIAVGIGAMALLVIGWRLRTRREAYALMLQGAGVGVLYLLVFAALRLYSLLPAGVAFVLLVAIVAFSSVLAVVQNSLALAVSSIAGGFLAPILASTGQGSHVALFSYYGVLNAGILAMAWFKSWRPLNLLGFAFTFVIGIAWGVMRYQPEFRWSTEPFLVLFFVFYVVIAILYATRQEPQLKGYVDGTLVFGTPLIAFGLQTALMRDIEYGLAYSALAVSAFYLLLATLLYRRQQASMRLLVEAFLALGVVFATLAIPLALDGRWSAASWALEGAAIIWVGVRQQRLLPRIFGVLLQFAAGAAFLVGLDKPSGSLPIFNGFYLGALIIALGAWFSAWYLHRHRDMLRSAEAAFSPALFSWGLLWWLAAGLLEIDKHVSHAHETNAALLLIVASALACLTWVGLRHRSTLARWYSVILQFGAAGLFFLIGHPADTAAFIDSYLVGCLLIATGALLSAWYLHRHRDVLRAREAIVSAVLLAFGLLWWLGGGLNEIKLRIAAESHTGAVLLFFTASALACSVLARRLHWPLLRNPALGLLALMLPVAAYQAAARLHPFAQWGYVAWPLALVSYYWMLHRHENEEDAPDSRTTSALHMLTFWLLAALASWEVAWQIDNWVQGAGTWPLIAWLVVPALLLLFVCTRGKGVAWPLTKHWSLYLSVGTLPLALFVMLWSLFANLTSAGNPMPLPYVPLLNPLDLAQALVFLCLITWLMTLRREGVAWLERIPKKVSYTALAALAFVWVNGVLLRTLHHWAGIAYQFDVLWRSTLVQAAFSIFWTMLALSLMVLATRKGLRVMWMTGAALMGVVVLKLFTIDISNVGGLARIVSFIGVAILMLVIGYFSPVPPKKAEQS